MSYYMGDYYRGDYYRGDPFLGGLFKAVGGIARSFLGLPAPAARPALPAAGSLSAAGMSAITGIVKGAATRVGTVVAKHPVLSAAGAAGTIGVLGGTGLGRVTAPGLPMKGFHVSRKTGKLVRNRHMRVTNPRALRRALRRTYGFAHLAMKTIHLCYPKKRGHFGGFRKRKKRRI